MNNLIGVIIFKSEIIFINNKSQFLEHQPVYLKVQKKNHYSNRSSVYIIEFRCTTST